MAVDYTNYDYDQVVARITELLRNKEGWGDAYDSSMGQNLIRMIADVTDNLHYMLERRTIENYLFTAKTQSAVFARAGELGYRANRVIANQGTLEITLLDGNDAPMLSTASIMIPMFSVFTYDGRTFVSSEDIVVDAGVSKIQVPVREGKYETITFAQSDFSEDNTVLIEDYQDIDNDTMRLTSEGVEFQDVTKSVEGTPVRRAMSFVSDDENFYDVRYETGGMRLILGDDTFGASPDGDLLVEMIRVDTIDSPVNTINNEFSSAEPVTDLDGAEYTAVIKNIDRIRRGVPVEDLETVKEKARTYVKTNGRAVTREDIDYWVREARVGGIIDARSMGEQELDSVVKNVNNVYINYVTDDADKLSTKEESDLRRYLDGVLMTTIHPVFRQVDNLLVQARLEASKNKNLEMSNAEFYNRLRDFLHGYFELRDGSIGRGIQHSEIVRDLHKQVIRRNGVDYDLVDYVKLELDCLYPLNIPLQVKSTNIDIDNAYSATDNDEFILIVDNIVCDATIAATDNKVDILNKMRDRINEVTPFISRVEFGDIAVDGFGNPLPIEIDAGIGEGLLIGTDTPFREPNEVLTPPAIGSTLAQYVLNAAGVDVTHYYYGQKAGRRPLIPLRTGTTVDFTAPTDTDVKVFMRTIMDDPSTETLLTTITAGTVYNGVFNSGEHSLQFEYVSNSLEDVTVAISYPDISDINLGLRIETPDSFGSFTVQITSGDLADFVIPAYNLGLPPVKRVIDSEVNQILPASLEIIKPNGEVVYKSKKDGKFIYPNGSISPTGRVDYLTSNITVPQDLVDGDYYVRYKQNKYQNIKTDETSTIVLLPLSEDASNPNIFSQIHIEEEL